MKLTKRLIAILFAMIAMMSVMVLPASAKSVDVKTGRFNGDSWTGYTTIYATTKKNKNQTPKIKVCSFNSVTGTKTNSKFYIEYSHGNYKKTELIQSGDKIKLKGNYSWYHVRFKPYKLDQNAGGFIKQVFSTGKNWSNTGGLGYWSIDAVKNCHF